MLHFLSKFKLMAFITPSYVGLLLSCGLYETRSGLSHIFPFTRRRCSISFPRPGDTAFPLWRLLSQKLTQSSISEWHTKAGVGCISSAMTLINTWSGILKGFSKLFCNCYILCPQNYICQSGICVPSGTKTISKNLVMCFIIDSI